MLRVTVRGGTEAGRRVVKDRSAWQCRCVPSNVSEFPKPPAETWARDPQFPERMFSPRVNPGSLYCCPDCGTRRP